MFGPDLKLLAEPPESGEPRAFLPAHQGRWYLSPVWVAVGAPHDFRYLNTLNFFQAGDARPFATLPRADFSERDWSDRALPFDKRLLFLPQAKLLVTIPFSNDKLLLQRYDVEEALDKSGIDYLVITTRPGLSVKKGDTYTYQLEIKSRKGGLRYKLESGPKGMTISDGGKVTWQVPVDHPDKDASIIISIRDSGGQEAFHTFTLAIQ